MRQQHSFRRRFVGLCTTFVVVLVLLASFSQGALGDDLFVLPGDEAPKPKKRKKAKAKFQGGNYKLPPIYGPRKEWQSLRSTSQITCTARYRDTLWAGTSGSGLIRWDMRSGGYRFYVPSEKDARARSILALAAAPNGDIWIGTNGFGVARLKRGRSKWKFYQYKHGLPGNIVQTIAFAPNGDVWVGTQRGVARLKRGRSKWKRYTIRKGFPATDIRAITVNRAGQVWFSPNTGKPFYLQGRRYVKIKRFPVIGSTCIKEDARGGLWFCNDQGAIYYKNGRGKLYTTEHGLTRGVVQTIHIDPSDGVWLGTRSGGISYYKNNRWVTMNISSGLPGKDVRGITGGPGGQLFAATHLNGAVRYKGGRWHRLPVGVVGNQIRAVAYSPDGSVWLGTASGASRYYKGYWFNYTNVLPNPDVRSFTFDPEGNVWIGTYGGGVVRFNGKKWKTFEMLDGLASNRIVASALTPEGIWFAHEQKGLSLYTAGKWKTFTAKNPRHTLNPAYKILTMFTAPDYSISIGSLGGGVTRHRVDGTWRKVRQMRGAATKGVVSGIAKDKNGRWWFGAKNGLYSLYKGKLKRYTKRDGLPHNHVLTVAADGNKIWLGTKKGVAVFDGNSWRSFTQDDGLAHNHVTTITVTPWGEKWFGTANDGLTIYRGE